VSGRSLTADGRPRTYHPDRPATGAERQAAYEARGRAPRPDETRPPDETPRVRPDETPARARPQSGGCPAFAPRSTRCKLCGEVHS
jgi:hypothetical protein